MAKIKLNDKVLVTKGKDQGKTGKVTQILPSFNKVVVEGINVMYKNLRPRKKGEKGQRVQFNGPVALSNLAVICPKCSQPARFGIKISQSSTGRKVKVRTCKKCQEVID